MNPPLEIDRVTFQYGNAVVLCNFSLIVTAGENAALTGPSGCGKSTLLRLIAGLESPQNGKILLDGKPASEGPKVLLPPHHRGLAMVFQDLALWPNLTALGNVELGLAGKMTRRERRERAEEALELCRVQEFARRRPAQLSGGQAQRVALARALAVRPRLLLLDEPFTGTDDALKVELTRDLLSLATRHHMTLLVATHDLAEARALGCHLIPVGCAASGAVLST